MTTDTGPRSKTITWDDPAPPLRAAATMTGIDFLRSMAAGQIAPPPIIRLLGMTMDEVEEGRVVFGLVPDESQLNPIGAVHGGVLCTALDSATGCAVHSTLPAGVGYTSIDLNVQYLRGVQPGMELIITGKVTKAGRRVCFAEATVTDASGQLIATATSSLLVIDRRG